LAVLLGRDISFSTLSDQDPVDFFRFELTRKTNFPAELPGITKDAQIILRNAKGKIIKRGKITKDGARKLIQKLKAGVYYIQVKYNGKVATATVSSDLVLTADVAGNKLKNAMKLGSPQPLSLIDYIGKDDTNDLIKFKVTEPTRVVLTLDDHAGNTQLTLLDAKGRLM